MGGVVFIGMLVLVVGAVWLVRNRAPSRKAMFQRYGVSYFKVLLRQRGVDLSNIPDAELAKIVAAKIQAAKRQATIKDLADKRFPGSNWKITLVRSLEAEANRMVSAALNVRRDAETFDSTPLPATPKAEAVEPVGPRKGMTLDQFVDATQKGKLYSTLSERQRKPPQDKPDPDAKS